MEGVGKSLNTPPYGVETWWYQGFGGVRWVDIGGVYREVKRGLGVGMEESQQISKFADCPFS